MEFYGCTTYLEYQIFSPESSVTCARWSEPARTPSINRSILHHERRSPLQSKSNLRSHTSDLVLIFRISIDENDILALGRRLRDADRLAELNGLFLFDRALGVDVFVVVHQLA
jgi:hypothetical protein